MGKHETGYVRAERDLYPTPPWVVSALAEHVDLRGLVVEEPACGDLRMVEALRLQGCARVHASDIVDYGCGQDEVVDFLAAQMPNSERLPDAIITNPPFGQGGRLATAFIEVGLTRIRRHGGLLALLLPCDFDSAKTRTRYFGDCPDFVAKIVLRKRIVWFQRDDGVLEAPKENSAWFLWQRSLLRTHHPPIILYAPETEPLPKTPDAGAPMKRSASPNNCNCCGGKHPQPTTLGARRMDKRERHRFVIPLGRPRIEHERDAEGWFVIRGNHAWLHGDRRQALHEFDELERIERWGSA